MDAPRWRLTLALVLVAGLAAAVVAASGIFGDEPPRTSPPAAVPAGLSPTTAASPQSTAGTASRGDDETEAILHATQAALDAWGEFAVTGDLGPVEEQFADGPQLRQLRDEAASRPAEAPGPPPYRFTLRDTSVTADDAAARVDAEVVLTRPGEVSQEFRWRIHLRRFGDEWRLWTVEAR